MAVRRPLLLAPLAVAAALAAGCGSSSPPSAPAPPKAPVKSAPAGGLRVGATDLRLGDASVGDDASALRELRVGPRRVDPDALRRRAADRQGVGAGASCPDQDVMPDDTNTAAVIASTLCLLNGERADAGLPPLTENAKLAAAALEHSQDMVAHHYFDHVTPDGRDVVDRIRATGYIRDDESWTVGENLAWGTGTLATPRSIMIAWMNSQGHRENILRASFREIGLGVVSGNPRSTDGAGATYTTNFGAIGDGRAASTTVAAAPAPKPKARARKASAHRRHRLSARRRARQARRHARRQHARATRAAIRHT